MTMDDSVQIANDGCALLVRGGGIEVRREGRLLYANPRPLFVTVKTVAAVSEFWDAAYDDVVASDGEVEARGTLTVPSGSVFAFTDVFAPAGTGFRVSRTVTVLAEGDDLGFSTKISLRMVESDDVRAYDCFAPGVRYRQNEFAPGDDLDDEYFWRMETRYALPVFAMQHRESGETVALSRWAADVTLPTDGVVRSENFTDAACTVGSIGMSRPESRTLNYLYYGFGVRKDLPIEPAGLSIDYVYPGADGQLPLDNPYSGLDYDEEPMRFQRMNHPVSVGFEQRYTVALTVGRYDGFAAMMREVWRDVYSRLRDTLFEVDNERHYRNGMEILNRCTRPYGDSFGLPFACQLPDMDVSSVSFQFGFVGQQPGIGYQLLRYGDLEGVPEAFEKGVGVVDFWVRTAQTPSGLPRMCWNPTLQDFEPYPHYLRMLADGVEAILDAYLHLRAKGDERPEWLEFCTRAADWLVRVQNDDGSFHRAYHADGSVRMDSRSNTPSVIRFLVQLHLVTGDARYRDAAVRAGAWTFENSHRTLEYRGGTCDNADIQDKEAGIYALFGFLALSDLTGEDRWLEGAVRAADYTETWTYAWSFPVRTIQPKHPFNQYSISGQSIITIGGGADVYMAACSYTYYRLHLITGDDHYLDFAEFIHANTRQSTDVDGSTGYAMPGLGHESGDFTSQTLQSHYHWLPWCTFVEVDPASRLFDTFGVYEIAQAQRLPPEDRAARNRIYDTYGRASL
ncbi:hypothetical protein SAMN06295885_2048 [Rathayibacter oskolensis]|uniref:Uncharacterized protein n=1 Tax=Rathayibacter oskolensis TaxID=1891671 RepID=A0A1X7NWJ9_9MICO|nr:hypothetical protein [Rathayibacter oskolensis]SMH42750.1 hypothetical protein SAMN06295885_2048 [Rathayibacter oskolensis]